MQKRSSSGSSCSTGSIPQSWEIKNRQGEVQAVHDRFDSPDGSKRCLWKLPGAKDYGLNNRSLVSLPLYGVHELDDEAALTVVTEGEKARDALAKALAEAPVNVVGTITGASHTPSPEVLEDLRGHEVICWPDTDSQGIDHMNGVADRLQGIAAKVRTYTWHDAPVVMRNGKIKAQDAADHPAVISGDDKGLDRLLNDLAGAPAYEPIGPGPREQPITAAELMNMEFEPTRWVVPDVLPEGLSLLAGKPKKGKSWMALGMCEAVATGGVAFGVKHVEQGDALYLALEDNKKRLKKRLGKVLDGRPGPDRMHVEVSWPRLDQGGAEKLDGWLTDHPDARLVVIDTLAKIRKPASGANVYAEDYAALELLLPLAAKHGVAIVVVHHLRKMAAADPMDEISSSTGLTAGVDGFLILRRTPGSKGPTLYVEGRDIEEPAEYALHWNLNTATWTIEGDAEEVHISKERADILLALNRSPEPMTPKEVSLATGGKYNNTKKLMFTMLGDGQLLKDDKGRYSPAHPTNPTDPGNPGNRGNPGNSGNPGNPSLQGYRDCAGGNPSGNPSKADTYGENGSRVTGVTGVTGDDERGRL